MNVLFAQYARSQLDNQEVHEEKKLYFSTMFMWCAALLCVWKLLNYMGLNVYIFGIWFVFCFSDILKGFIVNRGACWMSYMFSVHKYITQDTIYTQKWHNNNNITVSILCKETESRREVSSVPRMHAENVYIQTIR